MLFPFISSVHLEYADSNVSDGTSILDELTAVAWCNSDLRQVNTIINEHDSFTDMKVIANKQSAHRTGVKQLADLAKLFVTFKQHAKNHTVSNVDPFKHIMKR